MWTVLQTRRVLDHGGHGGRCAPVSSLSGLLSLLWRQQAFDSILPSGDCFFTEIVFSAWVCACTPSKAFFFFFPFCLTAFQPAGDFADFSSWSEACQWPGFARGTEHNCPSRSGRNLVRKGTFYHTRGSHTTSYISFLNMHRPQEPPER